MLQPHVDVDAGGRSRREVAHKDRLFRLMLRSLMQNSKIYLRLQRSLHLLPQVSSARRRDQQYHLDLASSLLVLLVSPPR